MKIRQSDEQTQTLVVQITESGLPRSYDGLQPFFCAKLGQSAGLGIIEQKLDVTELTKPKSGQLEYTMRAEDWQQIGRQTGYFSFRKMSDNHEYVEQFSTRDFYYTITKSVFSDGITEVKKDGSTYIWTIEDMKRMYIEFIRQGENELLEAKEQLEKFVFEFKDIINSVDPGGKILVELIAARQATDGEIFSNLQERLQHDFENLKKTATDSSDGMMTKEDKIRLNKIAESMNTSPLSTYLNYMMVSLTVGTNETEKPSSFEWSHVSYQDATATLCVMVGLSNALDPKPTMISDSLLQETLDNAKSQSVKIDMQKPHLGVGYKDSFSRKGYKPSDINLFFENWEKILMHYGAVCVENDIPILCIGCEQEEMTKDISMVEKWKVIIDALHENYPELQLTYACTGNEIQTDSYLKMCEYLDLIGLNIYLNYYRGDFEKDDPSFELIAESFAWTYEQMLRYYRMYPQKKMLITEIGCIPVNYGLSVVVPFNYATELENDPNYDVVQRLMKAAFYSVFSVPFVIGFSWWHTLKPFVYFRDDYETSAEKYMKEEIERVRNNGV